MHINATMYSHNEESIDVIAICCISHGYDTKTITSPNESLRIFVNPELKLEMVSIKT